MESPDAGRTADQQCHSCRVGRVGRLNDILKMQFEGAL
jgi:hypothetical protein